MAADRRKERLKLGLSKEDEGKEKEINEEGRWHAGFIVLLRIPVRILSLGASL